MAKQMREQMDVEVDIISAHDLRTVSGGLGWKMSLFAAAWITARRIDSALVITHTITDGGRNLTWNSKLLMSCDAKLIILKAVATLTIKLRYRTSVNDHETLGVVRTPLSANSYLECEYPEGLKFTEQILLPSGKKQGSLDFAMKIYSSGGSTVTRSRNPTAASDHEAMHVVSALPPHFVGKAADVGADGQRSYYAYGGVGIVALGADERAGGYGGGCGGDEDTMKQPTE